MKHMLTMLVLLTCLWSAAAQELDKAGNWKDLGMTMFKSQLVTLQYDASNVMFPGIGRPEPSMDIIVRAIYPTQMDGHLDKQGVIRFTPRQDFCYLHVSAVATDGSVTFHVLRFKGADALNPTYDGHELLQYQDGQALLGRLTDRSQLEPLWQKLRPIVSAYAQSHPL